jgi:hypothetical protein
VTEKEITAIVAEAIRSFNALSPEQRRLARRSQRGRYVSDDLGTKRWRRATWLREDLETKYDDLDF